MESKTAQEPDEVVNLIVPTVQRMSAQVITGEGGHVATPDPDVFLARELLMHQQDHGWQNLVVEATKEPLCAELMREWGIENEGRTDRS
jgi:hypothetical protein